MKPNNFQPVNTYTLGPSSQIPVYTPNQPTRINEPKPVKFMMQTTPSPYTFVPTNCEDPAKKIATIIKPVEQRKECSTPTLAPKKITRPAFLNNKQHHNSDTATGNDSQTMRREQSEPDLRTTCPNVFKKVDPKNGIKEKEVTSLRYTTNGNGISKLGMVMSQAKKYDEQEQQRNMKKNPVVGSNHQHANLESPYKSMTDSKKQPQKPSNFKSLNQIWSNKERGVQKPKKNVINGFEVYKQLGKGKFGEVYLARHSETGFIVALKKIIKAKVIEYKMIEQFKRQIKLHSALDHPNIVKFFGFFEDAENIYLILEYISGGTLFDYLAQKDMLTPKEAAEFLKDTIEALCYMHDKSIAHRDIKPENIVLTAERVAKLCDFGWSALIESSRTTYCGTFDYAPPEILERKNYDTAVDMWCIGVLAFELLTGKVPFEGDKRKQIMQKIISVDKTKIIYPVEIPEDAKSFIEQLVQKDPTQRPKCKDLLNHPFIVNNTKKPCIGKDKKF